jgi:hypothetical protein
MEVVIDATATRQSSSKKAMSMGTLMAILLVLMTTTLTASAWSVPPVSSSSSSITSLNNRRCHSNYLKHGRMIDNSSSHYNTHRNKFRKLSSSSPSSLQLEMLHVELVDYPITDLVGMAMQQQQQQQQYDPSSSSAAVLDMLSSSITLAKANAGGAVMSSIISPNQSIAPLPETLQSILGTTVTNGVGNGSVGNIVTATDTIIPDMYTMPGGTPKIGNTFLSGLFREMYDMGVQPHNAKMIHYYQNNNNPITATIVDDGISSGGSTAIVVAVPGRELDIVARYADLLSRIPLVAAIYAIIDFFFINAEEDVTVSELLLSYNNDNDDDDRVDDMDDSDEYEGNNNSNSIEAILDVENRVFMQRIGGLFSIVLLTITWSLLTYHPVPFNEL